MISFKRIFRPTIQIIEEIMPCNQIKLYKLINKTSMISISRKHLWNYWKLNKL